MPVYNVVEYVEASVRSVLDQQVREIELIIVDDASTDGTRAVVERLAQLDPRIRFIPLIENTLGGAGTPSNIGLRAARGRYIGFVDGDDLVTTDGFAKLLALAERSGADVTVGDFCTFNDGRLEALTPSYDRHRAASLPRNRALSVASHPQLLAMSPVPWRKIYSRVFLEAARIEYPEGDYFFEDNALHWAVLAAADRIALCDAVVALHRMGRPGQSMGSGQYRKAAFAHHFELALEVVLQAEGRRRRVLVQALADRIAASQWVLHDQTDPQARAMIGRRFADLHDRAVRAGAGVRRGKTRKTIETLREGHQPADLTIVVAARDGTGLRATVAPLLTVPHITVDILVVVPPEINTKSWFDESDARIHVFAAGRREPGRMRNAAIPLLTGRYSLFVDEGDRVEPVALGRAVRHAAESRFDVLFIEDGARADGLRGSGDADVEALRDIAARIDPATARITRTSLLGAGQVFFGGGAAHYELPFHWQSIALATRLGTAGAPAISRSTTPSPEATKGGPSAETLRYTAHRLTELGAFPGLEAAWRDST